MKMEILKIVNFETAKKLREVYKLKQGITEYKYAYDISTKDIQLIKQGVYIKSINIIYYDAFEIDN